MPGMRLTSLILGVLLTAAACSTTRASSTSHSLASQNGVLRGKPTLTIAVKIDEPGLGYIENGDPQNRSGLDIDVAYYIARHLGPKPKHIFFIDVTSANRESLITGNNPARTKVDLVIASYTIDDQRERIVSFAGPYLVAGQTVLVRKADASVLNDTSGHSLEMGLRNLSVCSVSDSTSAERLEQDLGAAWAARHLMLKAGYQDCVVRLAAGAVDAVSTDNTILAGYLSLREYVGKLYLAKHTFSTEPYGVGLAKDDTADRLAIDAVLRKMINDGSWARFVQQNLGPNAGTFLRAKPTPEP